MYHLVRVILCALCVLLGSIPTFAQSINPEAVGARPVSANFDVFPDSTTYDEGRQVIDTDGLGVDPDTNREEFIIWAMDEDSGGPDMGCGPIKTVVSRNGIEIAKSGGYLADDGYDFCEKAAKMGATDEASGYGYFSGVGADETTGNFVGTHNMYGMDTIVSVVLQPNSHPFANYEYIRQTGRAAEDFALFQRYDRNCNQVSKMTYGQNIPSPYHNSLSSWPAATSRSAGCDVLSDGNTVYVIADNSSAAGTGPAQHYSLDGINANLFSITNASATAYIVNTTNVYRRPDNTTISNGNAPGTAAGYGFWVTHVDNDGGTIAVFRNNGTRIGQIFDIAAPYNADPANLLGSATRTADGSGGKSIATANDLIYIPARYRQNSGALRPCILRFQVDVTVGTITALPALLADDDIAFEPSTDCKTDDMDIAANNYGFVAICWRNRDEAAWPAAARVFQGTEALTNSFYVSSITTTDTGADSYFVKVALSGTDLLVVWESSNGITNPGTDCYGLAKPQATLGRVFELQKGTRVEDWDLY